MAAGEDARGYPQHPRDRAAGHARRRRILDEAVAELGRHGWAGASVPRIAEASGLRTAGLLHHFPNKTALLLAVLERIDAISDAKLAEAVGERPRGLAALEGVVESVTSFVDRADEARAMVVVAAEAVAPGHPAGPWTQARYEAFAAWFAGRMHEACADGDLRAGLDPEAEAARLLALGQGALMVWLAAPDLLDPAETMRTHLHGLRASAGA